MAPPKYFLEVKGANHFSFNNRFIDDRMVGILSGNKEIFMVIRRYSTAFLENHIADKNDAIYILKQSNPMLTRYLMDNSH